jgi:hypothetical protein
MMIMAAPTGGIGFAPPRRDNRLARRTAAVELIATISLTVSLVVAATAVSLGNRALSRGNDGLERPSVQTPIGDVLDQSDGWLSSHTLR